MHSLEFEAFRRKYAKTKARAETPEATTPTTSENDHYPWGALAPDVKRETKQEAIEQEADTTVAHLIHWLTQLLVTHLINPVAHLEPSDPTGEPQWIPVKGKIANADDPIDPGWGLGPHWNGYKNKWRCGWCHAWTKEH